MAPSYKTNDPKGWRGNPKRGAALGRSAIHDAPPDFTGMLTVRRIFLTEGYDENGTYFGDGQPLYWYASEGGEIDDVLRAGHFKQALQLIRERYPNVGTFNREATARLNVDEFFHGYLQAALWSSNDESDESGGDPLDKNYSVDDIAESSKVSMRLDCEQFIRENPAEPGAVLRVGHHPQWRGHGLGVRWPRFPAHAQRPRLRFLEPRRHRQGSRPQALGCVEGLVERSLRRRRQAGALLLRESDPEAEVLT